MSIQLTKDSDKSNFKIGHIELSSPKSGQFTLDHVDLNHLDLENPFWQFSLNQWENQELQKVMLKMQDEQNFRVNLLLFSIWLSTKSKRIDGHLEDIYKLTQAWHEIVVGPLRMVRKNLPGQLKNSALKAHIQSSEIQAEQVEQAILFQFSSQIPIIESQEISFFDIFSGNLSASQVSPPDLLLIRQAYLQNLNGQD